MHDGAKKDPLAARNYQRQWREAHPGYGKAWRLAHPGYDQQRKPLTPEQKERKRLRGLARRPSCPRPPAMPPEERRRRRNVLTKRWQRDNRARYLARKKGYHSSKPSTKAARVRVAERCAAAQVRRELTLVSERALRAFTLTLRIDRRDKRPKRIVERARKIVRDTLKKTGDGRGGNERDIREHGTTWRFLRYHLETQFQPGMEWDNYGYGAGMWNVDHITPCAKFDLSDDFQLRTCNHWSNLRPLWHEANMEKGAR